MGLALVPEELRTSSRIPPGDRDASRLQRPADPCHADQTATADSWELFDPLRGRAERAVRVFGRDAQGRPPSRPDRLSVVPRLPAGHGLHHNLTFFPESTRLSPRMRSLARLTEAEQDAVECAQGRKVVRPGAVGPFKARQCARRSALRRPGSGAARCRRGFVTLSPPSDRQPRRSSSRRSRLEGRGARTSSRRDSRAPTSPVQHSAPTDRHRPYSPLAEDFRACAQRAAWSLSPLSLVPPQVRHIEVAADDGEASRRMRGAELQVDATVTVVVDREAYPSAIQRADADVLAESLIAS